MTYAVLVRFDSAGAWPVIVSADDKLENSDGTRWRFVAAVPTFQEAVRLHRQLQACPDGGGRLESSRALESGG
jgi:hypothetical protein